MECVRCKCIGEHSNELTWISPHCSLSWSLFYSWVAAAGTAVGAGTKKQDARSNSKAMSRVPWHQFQDWQLQAHLVVGVVAQAEGPVGGDELNEVQYLLNRLARQQKLGGAYAATVVRETGRPEVYFAFVEETDARTFGDTVQAEATDRYSGWASERAFDLPSEKLASLEASLPAPRDNPRQREADGPRFMRRVRRGPRQSPVERYDEEE
jgi:hypothetical protein